MRRKLTIKGAPASRKNLARLALKYGGIPALAERLGVGRESVWRWIYLESTPREAMRAKVNDRAKDCGLPRAFR